MDQMDFFLELYGTLPRAGPGDNASTGRAFGMMTDLPPGPGILDIGCGPGMQTIELLKLSGGNVVALDLLPRMITRVEAAAQRAGLADRLETVQADMNEMAFAPATFQVTMRKAIPRSCFVFDAVPKARAEPVPPEGAI